MDKFWFALEKVLALVLSQRTLASLTGIIAIAVVLAKIGGPLLGYATDDLPDDAKIEAVAAAWLALIGVVVTSILQISKLVQAMLDSIEKSPPSLIRGDYEGFRKP